LYAGILSIRIMRYNLCRQQCNLWSIIFFYVDT